MAQPFTLTRAGEKKTGMIVIFAWPFRGLPAGRSAQRDVGDVSSLCPFMLLTNRRLDKRTTRRYRDADSVKLKSGCRRVR
jgi:hypothetical protein